jgi:hypothetical protein
VRLGITDGETKLATVGQVIDREVASAKELTPAEAAAVMDWIKHEESTDAEPTLPDASMSAGKAKGTRHESAIVAFLREHGFTYADRVPLSGARPRRRHHRPRLSPVIEAKNQARHSLAEWLDEANAEAPTRAPRSASCGRTAAARAHRATATSSWTATRS